MEQRNYMSNQSSSTDQSLNTSNQNYPPHNTNNNIYYINNQLTNKKIMENPKVIRNKLLPQKESVYTIYQQNKKIFKNNESFNLGPKKQLNDNTSFFSQKPVQTFELNLNINNNNNKVNNLVNIDNQSSAFEICFLAKKKPKKNFKITTLFEIGPNQKPLSFAFYAEKSQDKYNENKNNNIKNYSSNIINELNIQNSSFISNRQIEANSFVDNEINFLNNSSNKKNELKIMQNPERKIEVKPKPVLQIMSHSSNKNNIKKLSDRNNSPHINGFSLEESNNNNNEFLKNNLVNISKSASMIVNNNNNQDMSFISNSKETENLLEMNNINIDNNYNNNKNMNYGLFGQSQGLGIGEYLKDKNICSSFGHQIENNNIYNGYIMINSQLCFNAEKTGKNKNNISGISNNSINNSINKKSAKKYIKIEYYDTQPVTFDILSEINLEENVENLNKNNKIYKKDEMKLSYQMYRVEEMEFNTKKEKKVTEENKDNEEKSIEKEENKSFNSNNKKRRKRRKKK